MALDDDILLSVVTSQSLQTKLVQMKSVDGLQIGRQRQSVENVWLSLILELRVFRTEMSVAL